MQQASDDARVLVRRCEHYDRDAIREIVAEGMKTLDIEARGKVFVKPNVVFAGDPKYFGRHAYTDPRILSASLLALTERRDVERLDVGENAAVGFPTRYFYEQAGYYDEVETARQQTRTPIDLFCLDEDRREVVTVGGVVHDTLRLSRTMARADTLVYLPRLKCHCVTKMTGAVKLNIGICCDDDRSIRHDFRLNEKIVDLLTVGWPDFVVMDAIEVGVGNEAFPTPRKLGLLLMSKNPIAVDLVGARLLGLNGDDVPYLKIANDRGYRPSDVDHVELIGDIDRVEQLDEEAKKLLPYDEEFYAWQDINTELKRLQTPIRFFWGPHRHSDEELCGTGCVMGIKMFLASYEAYGGAAAFRKAKPAVFVAGRIDEPIDADGGEVFLIGKCAKAPIRNAKKVIHIEKCFTTANDMSFAIATRLGMPTPLRNPKIVGGLARDMARSSVKKLVNLRFAEDLGRRMRSTRR